MVGLFIAKLKTWLSHQTNRSFIPAQISLSVKDEEEMILGQVEIINLK